METRREKEDYMNNIDQERYFDDHVNEKMIKENTKDIMKYVETHQFKY